MFLNSTRMAGMALVVFSIGGGAASAQGTMQHRTLPPGRLPALQQFHP